MIKLGTFSQILCLILYVTIASGFKTVSVVYGRVKPRTKLHRWCMVGSNQGLNCIGDVWSGQTKDYKIGICCFSTKHAALRRRSKD